MAKILVIQLLIIMVMSEIMAEAIRTCLGCGKRYPKTNLLRFVSVGNEVVVDLEAKALGRGAYCCFDKECIRLFIQNKKRASRAFRVEITGFRFELASIFRS